MAVDLNIDLNQFLKAINSFELALNAEKTDLNRDATIQRFEFCVELAWKTSKKVLGLSSIVPKQIVRDLAQEGIISSAEEWLDFIELRNLSSHTYKEEVAEKVYKSCRAFLKVARDLHQKLESYK